MAATKGDEDVRDDESDSDELQCTSSLMRVSTAALSISVREILSWDGTTASASLLHVVGFSHCKTVGKRHKLDFYASSFEINLSQSRASNFFGTPLFGAILDQPLWLVKSWSHCHKLLEVVQRVSSTSDRLQPNVSKLCWTPIFRYLAQT